MKTLATLSRHLITYVTGLLVAWVAIYLTGEDLKTATDAANSLVEPLVILAGFVAVVLSRLAMPIFDKLFRQGAGEDAMTKTPRGGSMGGLPLWVLIGTLAGLVGCLPACSTSQLAVLKQMPLRACVVTDQGTVCYSTKDGISAEVDAHSRK